MQFFNKKSKKNDTQGIYIRTENGTLKHTLIRRRYLFLAMLVLVVILITLCVVFIRSQVDYLNKHTQKTFCAIQLDFKHLLIHQANSMAVMEDIILRDKIISRAMKAGNKKLLIDTYAPLFTQLKENYGITHFYFIRPDRVTLLRLHKPDRSEDLLNRFTLKKAKRTGSTASGIELGPLGTFTLRVVKPVYYNSELVGYLELGKEIEDVLSLIRNKYDIQLMIAINKNELNRKEWEAGMKMLEREAKWERYANAVIVYSSFVKFPVAYIEKIMTKLHGHNQHIANVNFADKSWSVSMFPLEDVKEECVGYIIMFKDVSRDMLALMHLFVLLIGSVLLVVIAMLVLLFLIIALRKANYDIYAHQQKLAFNEKRFRDVAEGISDWIWELDSDMKFTYASKNITMGLGYEPEEVIGKTPFDIMTPDELEHAQEAFSRMRINGQKIKDLVNWKKKKDGSLACMLTNGIPLLDDDGNIQGYRGADKDVTLRIQAEEELKKAKHDAECASIAKSEFLTMMSHEIRTPLNGLVGFADIIRDTLSKSSCCRQRDEVMEHLEIIKTCGINLTELMNDILDLASIEAGGGEIAVDGFSPEQIINECIEIFCIKAEENNVKIKFQPEKLARELVGARKRFKQIMFNLIGNAIKFTHDGQVEIETDFKEDHLQVKVKDSGIGIPDEMKEKILLPFTQGDQSSTRKYGGTGLGLTIVSKNLNILGGKLHINSELGKGTTVSFTFPAKLKDNNVIQCVDNKKCSELKTNCNILLVEDNEISVLYLKRIFNSLGISYKIAMCFAEMKDVCDQGFMPDVVLMDISLPNESGFECFKWLKDKFHERKIKYIAQTAHVLIEETECYKSEGFDSFIGKPYTKEELISTINSVL